VGSEITLGPWGFEVPLSYEAGMVRLMLQPAGPRPSRSEIIERELWVGKWNFCHQKSHRLTLRR